MANPIRKEDDAMLREFCSKDNSVDTKHVPSRGVGRNK